MVRGGDMRRAEEAFFASAAVSAGLVFVEKETRPGEEKERSRRRAAVASEAGVASPKMK